MTKKKIQKAQGSAAVQAKRPAKRIKPLRHGSARKTSQATLDVNSFPYILSLIIGHSSKPTLATLLRCSKSTFQMASRRLYRNITLTPAELVAIIDAGRAPSRSKSTSVGLGNSFSHYLRECFQHCQTLHIDDYDPYFTYPKIPRGLLTTVRHVILYHREGYHTQGAWYQDTDIVLPTLFRELRAHIYVWSGDRADFPPYADIIRLPRSILSFTLLVPKSPLHRRAASTAYDSRGGYYGKSDSDGPTISTVMIPWDHDSLPTGYRQPWVDRWITSTSWLETSEDYYVGAEYTGLKEIRPKHYITGGEESIPEQTFKTFREWLGEIESGTVFTLEQEEELRIKDVKLRLRISEDKFLALGTQADEAVFAGSPEDFARVKNETMELLFAIEDLKAELKVLLGGDEPEKERD